MSKHAIIRSRGGKEKISILASPISRTGAEWTPYGWKKYGSLSEEHMSACLDHGQAAGPWRSRRVRRHVRAAGSGSDLLMRDYLAPRCKPLQTQSGPERGRHSRGGRTMIRSAPRPCCVPRPTTVNRIYLHCCPKLLFPDETPRVLPSD